MTSFSDIELEVMAVDVIFNYFNEKYTKTYIKENFTTAVNLLKIEANNLYKNNRKKFINRQFFLLRGLEIGTEI